MTASPLTVTITVLDEDEDEPELFECSWCGAEIDAPWYDRSGDAFCSRSHRDQSTAAVARLRRATDDQ